MKYILLAILMMSYPIMGLAAPPSPGYSISYEIDNVPDTVHVGAQSEMAVEMSNVFVLHGGGGSGGYISLDASTGHKSTSAHSGTAFHIEDPGRQRQIAI